MWKSIFRVLQSERQNPLCQRCLSSITTSGPTSIKVNQIGGSKQPHLCKIQAGSSIFSIRSYAEFTKAQMGLNVKDDQKTTGTAGLSQSSTTAAEPQPLDDIQLQADALFKGLETDFPCLLKHKTRGPEPSYDDTRTGYKVFSHKSPFHVRYNGGVLPELDVAYETWGELNENRDNAVLLSCGLSASSHAKSHPENPRPGWWEKFVGPGLALDTNKFFVICANNLGGCNGTSGPSSINPINGKPYATQFPVFSVEDIVRSQFLLLDHLNVDQLYASVGSSLGGMLSITSAVLFPERVSRVVSISACAKSHPSSIAMRYIQRKAIMTDPDWQKGYYYNTDKYPRMGMKLAREIATLTYRSGPEWERRFGRQPILENEDPSLCPYFMIENYLDYQGESFLHKLDPNTLLYISKAMDLFDLSEKYGSLQNALGLVTCPVMIIGVQSDILFPVWQQRELADVLRQSGNNGVTYYELNSLYGHDTFLLDLTGVGSGVKGFLETDRVSSD